MYRELCCEHCVCVCVCNHLCFFCHLKADVLCSSCTQSYQCLSSRHRPSPYQPGRKAQDMCGEQVHAVAAGFRVGVPSLFLRTHCLTFHGVRLHSTADSPLLASALAVSWLLAQHCEINPAERTSGEHNRVINTLLAQSNSRSRTHACIHMPMFWFQLVFQPSPPCCGTPTCAFIVTYFVAAARIVSSQ